MSFVKDIWANTDFRSASFADHFRSEIMIRLFLPKESLLSGPKHFTGRSPTEPRPQTLTQRWAAHNANDHRHSAFTCWCASVLLHCSAVTFLFQDEADDGESRERPAADTSVLPRDGSSDRATIHTPHPIQHVQRSWGGPEEWVQIRTGWLVQSELWKGWEVFMLFLNRL